MVNFGLNSASILGIFLAVAGAALYFMRSIRPELSRDQDIFFAAVGLLCGFILLFQGWRLDPILQFGQFLLTGTTVFFAYEAIRLRGVATEAVKRNTPIVDDDRPVSRAYRQYDQEAELYDQLEPEEDIYENRRLRGYDDPRNNTRDRYEAETRRSKSRGGSSERPVSSTERSTKRRPRPTNSRPPERSVDTWDAELDNSGSSWEEKPARSSRPRSTSRPESRDPETQPKPKKRRPASDERSSSASRDRDLEATPADYVDYQPIDESPDTEKDKPGRFDY